MKKLLFLSMVCTAMIFTSCGKKAVLETSIPKNAVMVAKFDIKSMALKADYKLFENQTVKAGVEMMKTQLKDDAQRKIFENFQKNPNSFGIDVVGDAYWFMNGQVVGFVLSVNDAKKIYDNILAFEPSLERMIEQKNGLYIVNQGGGNIAWNSAKMVIIVDYQQIATGAGEPLNIADYFDLPKDKSIVSDKNYQKLVSAKGDISLYYTFGNYAELMENFDGMYRNMSDELGDLYEKFGEFYKNLDGVSAILTVNFEKGKIVSKAQTLFANTEAEKKFKEFYDYSNAKLSGEFLKYVPQNPLLLIAMSFDGEKILGMLDKMGFSSIFEKLQGETTKFDIKAVIASINGDFVLSVNSVNPADRNAAASVSVFAKLANPELIKSVIDSLQIPQTEAFSIGVKDDVLYGLYGGQAQTLFAEGAENALLAKKAKGQPAFIYGDVSSLKETLQPLYSQSYQYQLFAPLFDKGLSLCETFESKYIDEYNGELTLNFVDKKQNSLKQIFLFIDEAISTLPMLR